MKIQLLCVGKLKESYFADAVKEYAKRLSSYAKLSIIEVADEKTPDGASPHEMDIIRQKEGQRLLRHLPSSGLAVALVIQGQAMSSEQLAAYLDQSMTQGISNCTFIIGGSLGLSPEVISRCTLKLSFSPMTFPHQLMRVILLEQVYRAFKIISGEPYHK